MEPVGDGEHGAALEDGAHHALDEVVRLVVDGGRGFIQHQDLGLPQQRPADAHELALAHREVLARLHHCNRSG